MKPEQGMVGTRMLRLAGVLTVSFLALVAGHSYASSQNKAGPSKPDFPAGYDAVEAAPASHKVIFENALVRVLEVTVPPAGTTIPMHHHRWPSFFLDWDTGGGTPHIRYHRADGSVRDIPGSEKPVHPGTWTVRWMKPEPLHEIEVVEGLTNAGAGPTSPPSLRIEIKCRP